MEIYQLRTLLAVAREGSITRASERLFLSQPAISAHIKAMEDELGIALFERTPRGMSLTANGAQLLERAGRIMALHREFIEEARRIKGRISGRVRLGAIRNPSARVLGRLLARLSHACPDIEVALTHGTSGEIARAIRGGSLDAGFYAEAGAPDDSLHAIEAGRFAVRLAAPPGWAANAASPDWRALAGRPWICPQPGTCCGQVLDEWFDSQGFRPAHMVSIDQESVTATLIAGGVGIGLLHAETAQRAQARGEAELLGGPVREVALLFACLRERRQEPLISAAISAAREAAAHEGSA